jgi:hypothetical protein
MLRPSRRFENNSRFFPWYVGEMKTAVFSVFCLLACGKSAPRDCAQLQAEYAAAVPAAQSCHPDAAVNECTSQSFDSIAPTCSCCFVSVTVAGASELNQIYSQSKNEGCPGPADVVCPAIIRISSCAPDADAGHCQ